MIALNRKFTITSQFITSQFTITSQQDQHAFNLENVKYSMKVKIHMYNIMDQLEQESMRQTITGNKVMTNHPIMSHPTMKVLTTLLLSQNITLHQCTMRVKKATTIRQSTALSHQDTPIQIQSTSQPTVTLHTIHLAMERHHTALYAHHHDMLNQHEITIMLSHTDQMRRTSLLVSLVANCKAISLTEFRSIIMQMRLAMLAMMTI